MANNYLKGKSVLVTGACGSVGMELIRQLLDSAEFSPKNIIGIDNNESQLFFLDHLFVNDDRLKVFLVDIRDLEELKTKMAGIDVVFHCAALKHVVLCERSPDESVKTNILGVQNIIAAARHNEVEKVIFTSSDKAVNPTNVMGTSKLMGERLMTAANNSRIGGTIFASTRFGNVLGSNGSVVPIFYNQIIKGGPVTITHRDMTRFVMSIREAVKLVIESAELACGGEVFITKMKVLRIESLAEAMISKIAPIHGLNPKSIKMVEIGVKPGEKLYEELMTQEETRRALEMPDYFSLIPAFRGIYSEINYAYKNLIVNHCVTNPYVSSDEIPLTNNEIIDLIDSYGLLESPKDGSSTRYWAGDKESGV